VNKFGSSTSWSSFTQEFRTFNFMSPWKDMLQLLGDEIAEPKEGEA
jgi:hypothetical protein